MTAGCVDQKSAQDTDLPVADATGPDATLPPLPDAALPPPPPDAALPPVPDAALPPVPDAALPPVPDAALPTPDAALPPTPDAALPPTPDAALPPAPDAALPPVPDAALPPPPPDATLPPPPADAEPPDAASPDAAPPPPFIAPIDLPLDTGVLGGTGPNATVDGTLRLFPGAEIALSLPPLPPDVPADGHTPVVLQILASVWRVEDGEIVVNGVPALFQGDADAKWLTVSEPWTVAANTPHRFDLQALAADGSVRITVPHGVLALGAARLADPRDVTPVAPAPPPVVENAVVSVVACNVPGCDDTPAIRNAVILAGSAPGGGMVGLPSPRYTLHSPLIIDGDHIHLAGVPGTTLFWDPQAPYTGEQSALTFTGGGISGPDVPLGQDYVAGTVMLPAGALPPDTTYIELTADDFGDIPAACLHGRDVEHFSRHHTHMARVLSWPDPQHILIDRPLSEDWPLAANPRMHPVRLLTGAHASELTLVANCPYALDHTTVAPVDCDNPEVVDDNGVVVRWTYGAQVEHITTRGFGKFSVLVEQALESHLADNAMDHPSAYGDGGRGYGVHMVRASRSIVRREHIDTCRHGAVVAFGASDSQILDGVMTNAMLSTIEVHGEASRDTLIRGNRVTGGRQGVAIGGGGVAEHCNDGPRHHVHHNDLRGALVQETHVSVATRGVDFTDNDLSDSITLMSVTLAAGDVTARWNRFGASAAPPVYLDADCNGVNLYGNVFQTVCDEAGVVLPGAADGAVTFGENSYCPR